MDECGEPTELVDRATLESLGVSASKVEMFLAGREAAPLPVSILRRLEILALTESVEEIDPSSCPARISLGLSSGVTVAGPGRRL